jgi:hypothetical protein
MTRLVGTPLTTNARAAGEELSYYAEHSEAVAGITQPRFAELVAAHCKALRWLAVTSTDKSRLLELADEAMYAGKHSGKLRVTRANAA